MRPNCRAPRTTSSASGSTAVMASGIVSLDLHDCGWDAASRVVLVVAVALWLWAWATGDVARRVAGVAATAALGSRLSALGWRLALWASFALAVAIWVGRRRDSSGSAFLGTVATQSIAILAAWLGLRAVAIVLLLTGLCLYARALTRFSARELLRGTGDHWVAGGALAITTLACADLDARVPAVVLWACAVAWLPALVAGELLNPRPGGMPDRWSTAFPLGMYAAMSFAVARLGVSWLEPYARAWTVVAAAVWAAVLLASVAPSRPGRG
jgi:hypothetical protein